MKITKIEVQKNNKDRFNLYIDNEFYSGIDSATYVHFNLKLGDVTKERLDEIKSYDEYRSAINRAIQYLSFKKRTEREIRDYLSDGEVLDGTIDRVIQYCYDNRYINHDDYAESLKNTILNTTDKGPEHLKRKLYEKGVESHIINQYYERFIDELDEDRMRPIIEKVMTKHMKKSTGRIAEQKTIQTLTQKGYNLNIILMYMNDISLEEDADLLGEMFEKEVVKWSRKYEGYELKQKVIRSLMQKGFPYDEIQNQLRESGMTND